MQSKFYWSCAATQSHSSYHSISACLGRITPIGTSVSSCPPAFTVGWERGRWFILYWKIGKVSHYPLFKPQKRLFTLDFIAQNQTQISSFSIYLRDLTVCSGELQSRASDMWWLRARRPSASLRASWNILSAGNHHGSVSLATALAARSFHWGNKIYKI